MEISLRSQLAAGVAVVGAAAIAVTPIVNPAAVPSLERVAANVQLVDWSNPITELIDTLQLAGIQLLSTADAVGSAFLPVPEGEGFIPAYGKLGWLPQLLNPIAINPIAPGPVVSGTPLLQAFSTNLSGYGIAALEAVAGIGDGVGALALGVPLALVDIVTSLIAGDPVDIQQIIEDTIIAPVTEAFGAVVNSATFIVENLLANTLATVTALPTLVVGLFGQAVDSVSYIANQVVETITGALGAGSLQGAWNALVDGVVGPFGVLGSVVRLSVGFGVGNPFVPDTYVPSLRQVISGGTIALGQAITNPAVPPIPTPGASVQALRTVEPAAADSAPAPAEEAAPAGDSAPAPEAEVTIADVKADVAESTPVVDNTPAPQAETGSDTGGAAATAADDAPAPKAKQRVSRKAG